MTPVLPSVAVLLTRTMPPLGLLEQRRQDLLLRSAGTDKGDDARYCFLITTSDHTEELLEEVPIISHLVVYIIWVLRGGVEILGAGVLTALVMILQSSWMDIRRKCAADCSTARRLPRFVILRFLWCLWLDSSSHGCCTAASHVVG